MNAKQLGLYTVLSGLLAFSVGSVQRVNPCYDNSGRANAYYCRVLEYLQSFQGPKINPLNKDGPKNNKSQPPVFEHERLPIDRFKEELREQLIKTDFAELPVDGLEHVLG